MIAEYGITAGEARALEGAPVIPGHVRTTRGKNNINPRHFEGYKVTEKSAVEELHEVNCLLRGALTEATALVERSIHALQRIKDLQRRRDFIFDESGLVMGESPRSGPPQPSLPPLGEEHSVNAAPTYPDDMAAVSRVLDGVMREGVC